LKTIFTRAWKYAKSDPDVVTLIVVAFVLTVLGLKGVADDLLNPAIVAMLGVLAFSQLKSRGQVSDVTKKWHRSRTDLLLWNFPPEYKAAQSMVAHNYFFAGTTMNRTLPLMKENITRILKHDGEVRIILPDPTCEPLMEMIAATRAPKRPEDIQADIEYALKSAEQLRRPDKGCLEIRTTQVFPSIGINAMDLGHPSKSIMIQMNEFSPEDGSERAPIFYLTGADRAWFNHFEAQLERLWNEGQPRIPQDGRD
jgi:hypothetical protein